MKKIFIFILIAISVSQYASAQGTQDNLSNLLTEGYTVNELETIFKSITYNNYKTWLKSNKFEYVKEFESGLVYFRKNEVVTLGVFTKKATNFISEIFFHSSPQKFYQAVAAFEEDASFKAIAAKDAEKKWYKNGFVFFANDDKYNIGIYRDVNNEASTSPKSTSTTANTATGGSSTGKTSSPKFDFSTAQKFADSLNAKMVKVHIEGYGGFNLAVLGRIDVTKRSVAFVAKDGELYMKINIPMNGDCDYGLKTEKVKFITNCTQGMDQLCVKLSFEYSCNNKEYKNLIVAFPRTGTDYLKEDLYNAILDKFRACCK